MWSSMTHFIQYHCFGVGVFLKKEEKMSQFIYKKLTKTWICNREIYNFYERKHLKTFLGNGFPKISKPCIFFSHLSHKSPINYIGHCCCRVQTVQKLNAYSVSYNYWFCGFRCATLINISVCQCGLFWVQNHFACTKTKKWPWTTLARLQKELTSVLSKHI